MSDVADWPNAIYRRSRAAKSQKSLSIPISIFMVFYWAALAIYLINNPGWLNYDRELWRNIRGRMIIGFYDPSWSLSPQLFYALVLFASRIGVVHDFGNSAA